MSFSVQSKNEMARVFPKRKCCQLAEMAALLRMDGTLQITDRGLAIQIATESAPVARKLFRLGKARFGLPSEIVVQRRARLRKSNLYLVRVPPQQQIPEILQALGIFDENMDLVPATEEGILDKPCCRRAYLRGAFLGGGSVNNPEGNYHLEIITVDENHAQIICRLMNGFGLGAKVSPRRHAGGGDARWYVVYLKESEHIIEFLSLAGAHTALLEFENIRIVKEMRNQVNRLVNCETANLNKTVNAAMRQVERIKYLESTVGLDNLPPGLHEVAVLRLQHPDSSLKELGEMLRPPVGKSGINHRLRKLEHLAEKLQAQGGGKD